MEGSVDHFKDAFKRFKKFSTQEIPHYVVDIRNPENCGQELIQQELLREAETECCVTNAACLGLKPPMEWRVYEVSKIPGLLIIPNPFLPCGQHEWVRRCLVDYPQKPNVCNLDAHMIRQSNGQLWPELDLTGTNPITPADPLACSCSEEGTINAKQIKVSNDKRPPLPLWLSKDSLLFKLRWVTLGCHYNWTTKEYSPDNVSPFPENLGQLSAFMLEMTGFSKFRPEACIVNYYHLDSTLSGHTDHSEKDLSLPLLSVSFGQSAVFLIGGKTKQVRPLPLLLNSGDIVIMSGESRLAYHGVPRIIPPVRPENSTPKCLSIESLENCQCWTEPRKSRLVLPTATKTKTVCACLQTDKTIPNEERGDSCAASREWWDSGQCQLLEGKRIKQCSNCRTDVLSSNLHSTVENISSPSPSPDARSSSVCATCSQLAKCWPCFMDYLSISRININVRQIA